VRERESNVIRKNCIFFTLFYSTKVAPSESVPLSKQKLETETHRPCIQKICRNTRVDSHSHAHALKTFTSSRPRKKKKREREREVTRRRKNASTNTHIFNTRMAKYYPDIAKGAKGTRFQTRFIVLFCTVFCSLFCANKSAISRPPPERISRRGVSPFFLSSFSSLKNRFIHRRFVLRKQILPGRETNLRRGTFFILVSRFYQISRETRGFLCVRIIIIGREIETSKDFCSGASRSKKP